MVLKTSNVTDPIAASLIDGLKTASGDRRKCLRAGDLDGAMVAGKLASLSVPPISLNIAHAVEIVLTSPAGICWATPHDLSPL
jgi:hypothetical protein